MTPAASEYTKVMNSISSNNSQLLRLRQDLEKVRTSSYSNSYLENPHARAQPQTLAAINQLTHNMKKLRKNLMKQQEVPAGSSPEEMMLYQKLLSGLKRTSRKSYAEPAMREANQNELNAMSHLTDQVHSIATVLESPEENIMHRNAHAQSRMLHRMNHVMDAMSDEMDAQKQAHYERMMSVLLKQHLSDPDYYDSLYDHLRDHEMRLKLRNEEFADQLNRGMLYRDLDRHISDEYYDDATGAILAGPYRASIVPKQQAAQADIAAATNKYDAQQKLENTQLLNQLKQYGAKKN